MIDVMVYKPSPYGLVFIHDKSIAPSGYALGFIIYHIKHERAYVSYKPLLISRYPINPSSCIYNPKMYHNFVVVYAI